jgi:hypothetical protein
MLLYGWEMEKNSSDVTKTETADTELSLRVAVYVTSRKHSFPVHSTILK